MSRLAAVTRALSPLAVEALESLYQHRLLSTAQLHQMHAADKSIQWVRRVLADLADRGLAEFVAKGGRGRAMRLWYLTELGVESVESAPRAESRRLLVSAESAASQLQAHTLAVNDVGVAFMRAARVRGDECGALAWRHELGHEIGKGVNRSRASELVVADAVLEYMLTDPRGSISLVYRFIELDRGTMPVANVAAKFAHYARLARYVPDWTDGTDPKTPLWRRYYPTFPAVLVVFAGRARAQLERRLQTIMALAGADPAVRDAAELSVFFGLLEDLEQEGPFTPVFQRLEDPSTPVDWLGRCADAGEPAAAAA